MKNLKGKRGIRPRTIGVVGASKGIGVTHFSLCLANYLHSVEGQEVIYVEVSKQSYLYNMVCKKQIYIGNSIAYPYKGVNYIVSATFEEAKNILLLTKCMVVVDIKELDECSEKIFALCEKKIVLGSMQPWKANEFEKFLFNKIYKEHCIKNILFLGKNNKKESKKLFFKEFEAYLEDIPFIEDPFKLKVDDIKKISHLFKEII